MKCIVNNVVIDVSFNQLSGLCALCFLEQVRSHLLACFLKCGSFYVTILIVFMSINVGGSSLWKKSSFQTQYHVDKVMVLL